MLNEQLIKDIDLEAKAEAKKLTARVPAYRFGYEDGWNDAGEKYADKWQAAEEKAARYENALKDFARQIKMHCNKMGIRSVVIQCIANRMEELDITEALTLKTSEDDKTG
jgi:hypothetical protein